MGARPRAAVWDADGKRFWSSNDCQTDTYGLGRGESARFTIRVAAPAVANNLANQQPAAGTYGKDACTGAAFSMDLGRALWTRLGLSVQHAVQPRAVGVGGAAAAQVVIENRTNQAKTALTEGERSQAIAEA